MLDSRSSQYWSIHGERKLPMNLQCTVLFPEMTRQRVHTRLESVVAAACDLFRDSGLAASCFSRTWISVSRSRVSLRLAGFCWVPSLVGGYR